MRQHGRLPSCPALDEPVPEPAIAPSAVEVDRRASSIGAVSLPGRALRVGAHLAGHRVSVRLDGVPAHLMDEQRPLRRAAPAPARRVCHPAQGPPRRAATQRLDRARHGPAGGPQPEGPSRRSRTRPTPSRGEQVKDGARLVRSVPHLTTDPLAGIVNASEILTGFYRQHDCGEALAAELPKLSAVLRASARG